jgi:hypothetical protein
MDITTEIFKGKSLSDLMKDIHSNSQKKDRQINLLIAELKPLVKSINDATMLVPLIKEYLDVSVKNDDQLVKLAAIAQKLIAVEKRSDTDVDTNSLGLTDDEKAQLLKEFESAEINNTFVNKTIEKIQVANTAIERQIGQESDVEF